MALTRDQIFAVDKSKLEKLAIPEWGGDVYIKLITAKEREAIEEHYLNHRLTNADNKVLYAIMGCTDENGVSLFGPDDVESLKHTSMTAIDRIYIAVMKHNFMGSGDVAAEKKD